MSDEIEYEPVTLAYLRASADKDWAAELVVKDKDNYYTVISMSDRALLNMARDATKLVAQRGFLKLEENENGLD
jgi:hypothetical protein